MENCTVKGKIKRAVIEVNGGCNYTCAMCPQSDPGRDKGFLKKMSLEFFQKVLDQLGYVECIQLEGSGEATLNRDLPKYIAKAKQYAEYVNIFTNGYNLCNNFMKDCVDAGLSMARFSVIGYNKQTYKKMMNRDAFNFVKENMIKMQNYIAKSNSSCIVASYHLILDDQNLKYEVQEYISNIIEPTQSQASIWKQHNWSGIYDNPDKRKGLRKTCGRPFAPEITIRAGGVNGKLGAVHPCCQVLGNDVIATLGHVSDDSIKTIWNNDKYQELRSAHLEKRFDDIEYCKNCDFLVDDPEVLVYNSNEDVELHHMIGTSFSLDEYR